MDQKGIKSFPPNVEKQIQQAWKDETIKEEEEVITKEDISHLNILRKRIMDGLSTSIVSMLGVPFEFRNKYPKSLKKQFIKELRKSFPNATIYYWYFVGYADSEGWEEIRSFHNAQKYLIKYKW